VVGSHYRGKRGIRSLSSCLQVRTLAEKPVFCMKRLVRGNDPQEAFFADLHNVLSAVGRN
jgi:hypothetical protein